jgi:c-di-GMP-binding flagellar brake protein YcgR
MQKPNQFRNIQLYRGNDLLFEFNKHFFFPGDKGDDRTTNDILTIRGRKLPEFAVGDLIDVVAFTKGGDRIKYFCYVNYSEKRRLELKLNVNQSKRLEDNRRFYKIKTEINARIHSATRDTETVTFRPASLYGRVQDINLGGVFITVDDNVCFETNDFIVFSVVLGVNKLKAEAKILRVQRDKMGDIVGYGCAFTDIKPYQEEMISSYITRVQIEERQLEKKKEAMENDVFSSRR